MTSKNSSNGGVNALLEMKIYLKKLEGFKMYILLAARHFNQILGKAGLVIKKEVFKIFARLGDV